jgi:streptomycin 6-kinase
VDIVAVPDAVRRKARAAGEAGAAWLAGLERTLAELAQAWDVSLGRILPGGTEALVVEATLADGRAVVIKVFPPGVERPSGELPTLLAARGRGYADVYAFDHARSAVLIERLGPALAELGLSIDTQIAIICETLLVAWAAPPEGAWCMNGAEKARSLGEFITTTWQELGKPCAAAVIDTARRYADERAQAFDPFSAVLGHGDAHSWNTLLVPGSTPPRFKFVDPDGLLIERAYDLGISMREWTADLLAGDPEMLGTKRCQHLAELSGVDPEPIWQWGFLERVSTGLLCLKVGLDGGREMLTIAEHWTPS